jgi:hypothetical protein
MRRILVAVLASALAVVAATAEAHFDHPVPSFSQGAPLSTAVNAGGPGEADWELITTIPTGNPHTDLDFFRHNGEDYLSAGTLAAGPNAGGQTIVQLTQGGLVDPEYVTGHPSASCVSTTQSVTGLQHDAEATPKGGQILNAPNPFRDTREAQLLVDATDAEGRCHDQGILGQQAPNGGLEIVDITNPAAPKEIGLTAHIGESHTVNIDPKRPHIAFSVTSDGTTIGEDGRRANETGTSNALDGFEVVDMSSCMNFPANTTVEQKRAACRPEVYRYRYPEATMATSSQFPQVVGGCHETEIYPDDTLTCAGVQATLLFDLSGAFADRGTPNDYTDDKPRGTPLPCRVRDSSNAVPLFSTGAKVTDCVIGTRNGVDQPLRVSSWLEIGSPSLQGVRHIGSVHHMGFDDQAGQSVEPPFDSTQDVFVSHEAELTTSRKHVLVTDERGGGVLPGGATCSSASDIKIGNGGIHAYPADKFSRTVPPNAAEAQKAYAQDPAGNRAIYRAQIRTQPQATVCTSHVMQQIPGQNRIFMGWYSQGTQVVDFTEPGDRIDMKYAGHFIPEGANTWTSAIFKVQQNRDGSYTYWGATGDFALSGTGRNAIDIYKVTLPAPPPAPRVPGTPEYPISDVKGQEIGRPAPACAASKPLEAVNATPRGRGLRFKFASRGNRPVSVSVQQLSTDRKLGKVRTVRKFKARTRSFNWNGKAKRRLPRGYYLARFVARAPNGDRDVRRIGLRRAKGRFRRLGRMERIEPCALLRQFKLGSAVFGGKRALKIAFQLRENSRVTVTVSRKGKRLKRFRGAYRAGRVHRLRFARRGGKLGDYRVTLRAVHPGKTSTVALKARRLR